MNARGHDLAQSAAADDTAITVSVSGPTSPPRRDAVEDADLNFTRKRPRLDSGSNSIRALSADPDSSTGIAASTHEQKVEMTIRSHPPSSPVLAAVPPEDAPSAANGLSVASQDNSPILIASEDDSGSPPVMVIDDDEPSTAFAVRMDAEDHFRMFPFPRMGNYAQVIRDIPQYIQGSTPIDGQLLPCLSEWLMDLPDPSVDIHGFYLSKAVFWDDFGTLVNKLLARRYQWMTALSDSHSNDESRYPFGDHFGDDMQTDHIFYQFFSAYVRLCSFLLLVDVHILSQVGSEEVYHSTLLSQRHIRYLHSVIRTDKMPVFHVLQKEYGADVRDMATRLHRDFLRANGAQNLLRLAGALFHQVPPNTQNIFATHISQLLSSLGWTIFELSGVNTYIDRSEYHRGALSFFQKYGSDLQDPSKPIDAGVARDLIQYYSVLVQDLCQWDETIAVDLVDQVLEFGGADSPTTSSSIPDLTNIPTSNYRQDPICYPTLVANAWKFKVLRKYIVKGNMGLRVMSIATMDAALVEIWREFSALDPTCKHPVMQYLADFLLHGQVVDYIVSVDSHPQLISRSGNIVGFLVVTHRWSDGQADAIWRTVSTSPDPRVVTATMTMLRSIISLMRPSDLFYLCKKLHDLPLDRYTLDILRFLRDLTGRIGDNIDSIDFDGRGHASRPWNVCIRILRDTAPSKETDKNLSDLHAEANDQFRYLTTAIPPDERHAIYRECAQQIADRSAKATGNFRVIYLLTHSIYTGDTLFFQQNKDLIRSVLEEMPAFVQSETASGSFPYQIQALNYRLDLLRVTICHSGMTIPADLYKDLWDHLIGDRALPDEARNLAWNQFLQATKASPDNDFCKQLVLSYIPKMDAQLYTTDLYEFVANYDFQATKQNIQTEHREDTLLQIPGATLLWPIILSSPTGIIEDKAARLLAARYVHIVDTEGVTLSEVEAAHVALVEQCMKELRAAISTLTKKSPGQVSAPVMDSEQDNKMEHDAEVRIGRILLFQKMMLEFVRQKAAFNRGRRVDSKVDAMDGDVPFGDAITVRYQCGNDRQYVTMGSDHTMDDLYRRLCHATGFTKINLFARGQRLQVFDKAPLKLSEVNFGGQVIVQRADGAELTRPLPELTAGSSAFETAIVDHFDEFFEWMDSDDTTSCLLFDFLSFFPARGAVADSVANGAISSEELFPPGKVYQARYAAQALQTRLREHIRNTATNEVFLSNAVQHLDKALLNSKLLNESLSTPQEVQLAAVLVNVLLEFLRERPSAETSASYFSDGPALINRLIKIVLVALETRDFAPVAQDSYAAIMETCLHSRKAWEAFTSHPDANRIHQMLLLVQPNQTIREHVARKIASICGGDLPSTCPITKAETAASFWTTISAILPHATQYPGQSQQLFQIAEHVFRTNDEYDRNEHHLRSKLSQWSTMLLNHEHIEFPEREEIDHVVHGLTKLLLCCVLSLKSFKKPVNAGPLMTAIFKKYIFVVNTQANDPSAEDPLPILESHTRQELYDLMLGLAEDRITYGTLLQLVGEIENEDTDSILAPNLVDRSMEIRSSTGYVGLYNPRAICYMNSLLTQLFMNLNFRQFILSLDVKEIGSQRLLFETQRLFAHMQNSFRKSTDPRDFAACVQSLDKTPIDITVQMDADEFYNLLFDQWEAQLLRQEHKQQFRSFYGGQILNQIKSKECEHVSERAEPFFAVQCDVQGKANLQESLQAYVQGDVMEGDNKYKCESCDGKFVDAVKRTCLKDVPDNLIFHLKRFEFDLNDFSRRKIYDHFAFPETLDISLYKIDHLADPSKPRTEDLFDLVGVLVHTGTCENGHYYSYIRQRPCSSDSPTSPWIEFNDSDVGPFNPAEISDRTFGGFAEAEGYARQTKQYSAYMLFYQRRTAIDEDQRHWMTTTSDRAPKIAVPAFFSDETSRMNKQFLREYSLFDPVHTKFLRQLHGTARTVNRGTCAPDHQQEMRAIHILLAHLGHVAWRQHNPEVFLELLPQLRKSMSSCSTCCNIALMWLAADRQAMTNIIIKCSHPKIRSQMRSLVIDGLKYLREREPTLYGIDTSDSDMEVDSSSTTESILLVMTHRLRMTANETMESIRGWEDYYLMLTQMAEMGHLEMAALLNNGFLQFCLKLFCMHAYNSFKIDAPELARIMEKRRGIFNRLICFVWKLLSHMDLRIPPINESQGRERQAILYRDQMKFPFTTREKSIMLYWSEDLKAIAVIDKILEVFDDSKVDHFYPGDIFKWLLETADESVHINLSRTIIEGLPLDPPYCDAYIHAALPFCEACPKMELITRVIGAIAKAIASPTRIADDRLPGGEAVLRFFGGLLKAENEHLFEQRHPHAFYHFLMARSRLYGIPLLCHYEDRVRKAAFGFFQQLYTCEEAMMPETVTMKYTSARDILPDLIMKFTYEKEVGRHRSFLIPLVDTCRILVQQLYILSQSQDPESLQFQNSTDSDLIYQFQQEVETRMRIWPHDEGTPLSQGEAFDQSDYGSESDEHDLIDN